MKKVIASTAAVVLLGLCTTVSADVFNLGAGYTDLETVTVGDPGNAGEMSGSAAGGHGPSRVCGAVNYTYSIGKYEVTAGQYTSFLNAVAATDTYALYNPSMATGCGIARTEVQGSYRYSVAVDYANRPVNYVSFWDSCRFANWLGNGQPAGLQDASTTERGAYTLDGYSGSDGHQIQRNEGWKWAVTSEDEWYKAAYYKGHGASSGYWKYATQSDVMPGRDILDVSGNNSNYYPNSGPFPIVPGYYTTVVGEFQNSVSPCGTFDQDGNILEWTESVYIQGYGWRTFRGGSFQPYSIESLQAPNRFEDWSNAERNYYGFRVSSLVPEPSSILALLCGIGGIGGMVLRKRVV